MPPRHPVDFSVPQSRRNGREERLARSELLQALIRVCDHHAGMIDPGARATLAGLPEWFPEKQNAPGRITGSVSTNCAQEVDYNKTVPDASVCHDPQEASQAV